MKRMMALLLTLVLINGCALAEGESAKQMELTEGILEHFCETTNFPAEDVEDLSIHCEFQDSPLSDPDIPDQRWVVEVQYKRDGGLLNATMDYILTQDGMSIAQESSAEDFKARYEAIQRVEPVLQAQKSTEEDLGPFRDWPMEKQQAFIDQYGDISDELSLLQCPQQTEPQYWEIDAAAQDALRSRGYADDKIAALRTQYSYYDSGVEWGSNVWTVDFFPVSNTDSDIASDHLSVQVEVNGSEITACTVFSYDDDAFFDGLPSNSEMEAFERSFE